MADYRVAQTPSGRWEVHREGGERPSSDHFTKQDAIIAARTLVSSSGGGQLVVRDRAGAAVSLETIPRN